MRAAFTRTALRCARLAPLPKARRPQMIVDELQEDGIPLPAASGDDVEVFEGTRVAVTV